MAMCYSQDWADAADQAFIERHGHDGDVRIIEMVARICRPSNGESDRTPPSQKEMERAKQLLDSCD